MNDSPASLPGLSLLIGAAQRRIYGTAYLNGRLLWRQMEPMAFIRPRRGRAGQ
jgi:hypothetical protein